MKLRYGLDDRPGIIDLFIYGLQWLAITVPVLVVISKVVAGLHFDGIEQQILYLQKVTFVSSILLIVQVLWGHRLPLVIGPATVLLVGIVAAQGSSMDAVYTSIISGGLILAVLAFSGLFKYLQVLFTPRVVAVMLLLIAFTLTPTILNLIVGKESSIPPLFGLFFAILLTFFTYVAQKHVTGIWKATLVIWAMLIGTVVYLFFFPPIPQGTAALKPFAHFFNFPVIRFTLDPGVLISFLFCFLALSINDLGSIQSLGNFLKADKMESRTRRGIGVTGIGNILAGYFGVIGSVNFSLSPGVIAATGCASRFTMVPAGFGLLLLSFSPILLGFLVKIPQVVIGSILIYVMSSQVAAGLLLAYERKAVNIFDEGIIIGLPLIIATLTAFLPPDILNTFPQNIRPILGNGFVMGVITVILLEHLVFKSKY